MAITKAEWKARLKRWVPAWYNETDNGTNDAVLQSIAKLLETVTEQVDDFVDETYLDNMTGSQLDLAGKERGVERISGESDDSYRERIRYIINTSNGASILNAINSVLNVTPATVIENWAYGFADDNTFADIDIVLSNAAQYNRFTVVIPDQNVVDDSTVKSAILQIIDDNKALGVLCDLVYHLTLYVFSESGDTLIMENGDNIIGEVV